MEASVPEDQETQRSQAGDRGGGPEVDVRDLRDAQDDDPLQGDQPVTARGSRADRTRAPGERTPKREAERASPPSSVGPVGVTTSGRPRNEAGQRPQDRLSSL